MSIENFVWAVQLRGVSPGAKLLAIYIANYCGGADSFKFSLEDASAWCCCGIVECETFLGELHRTAGLDFQCGHGLDVTVALPKFARASK